MVSDWNYETPSWPAQRRRARRTQLKQRPRKEKACWISIASKLHFQAWELKKKKMCLEMQLEAYQGPGTFPVPPPVHHLPPTRPPSALCPWKAMWSRPALLLTPKHAHLFWPGETLPHNIVGTWDTSILSTILDSSFSLSPCETPPQPLSAQPLNIWYETWSHTTTTTTLVRAPHLDNSTTKKKADSLSGLLH